MKIKELNISEFGGIKDKKIILDEGMNVIFGENETGKSSILLFIKFMLYGLGRRSQSNIERERSISWSGHTAAGSMTFEHSGRAYRIERRFVASTRSGSETVNVVSLADGTRIDMGAKEPGEYFLGASKEVFESTACVGQLRSSDINGEKTSASIQNLLSSADESVDTADVIAKLDKVRVSYRHKNQTGGSLYESEKELSELRRRMEDAREFCITAHTQEQKLEAAVKEYEVVKHDFEIKDCLLSEMNRITLLKRFRVYNEKAAELDAYNKKADDFRRAEMGDFVPTRTHLAELKNRAEALEDALKDKEARQRELDLVGERLVYDATLAELGEKISENGESESIIPFLEERKKKIKRNTAILISVWVACAAVAACGVVVAILGALPALAALIALVGAFCCNVAVSSQNKKMKKEIRMLAEKYLISPDELAQKAGKAKEEYLLKQRNCAEKNMLLARLEEAKERFERAESIVAELLEKSKKNTEATAENAFAEAERIEKFLDRFERIKEELLSRGAVLASEKAVLDAYNEEELAEGITIDINEVTHEAISQAERERSFLLTKKTAYEKKITALRESLIGLRANAKDPLELADEIKELEEKYRKESEFYSALTLAMESVERAGEAMGGSILPEIATRAGELMARISGNKYTVLRTTGSLELSLEQDGFGVNSEYLSSGTKDSAYLALRISLFMKIFSGELPPLVLDEALCQLDTKRAGRLLALLCELSSDGVQCICFTSHERESEILNRMGSDFKEILLN